jgi:hypothetical protein
LWGLVGGLAVRSGVLSVYEPGLYAVLAVAAGIWQYRTRVRTGPERGRLIFVGSQLLWLVILLAQNGLFTGNAR